jgi:ketosteroid isomerase-like protein
MGVVSVRVFHNGTSGQGAGAMRVNTEPITVRVEPMSPADWPAVRSIYEEGIATGVGTFETAAPSWEEWDAARLLHSRLVAREKTVLLNHPADARRIPNCGKACGLTVSIQSGSPHQAWPELSSGRGRAPLERGAKMVTGASGTVLLSVLLTIGMVTPQTSATDEKTVAALDTEYQTAVKNNDADTKGRILADDFVLVRGTGQTYTKADLLRMARTRRIQYEHQEDSEQMVRVWGQTAVVTAKLWAKGTDEGSPFEFVVWFSDTYVRTPAGWRYVLGQVGQPLANPSK